MGTFLDLTNVKDSSGFDLMPEGEYYAIMDDCSIKDTKSGTGQYVNAKLRVLEGPMEGRVLFHTFNIKNDNVKAVEIGLSQLKNFMTSAGQKDFVLKEVLDLVGMRCDAVVKVRKDEQYGDKNVVSRFKPHSATPPTAPNAAKGANPF